MTKEEMKQALLETVSDAKRVDLYVDLYVEKFYNYPIEEWEFCDEGNYVKGFHSIPDITPEFYKELLEKRKKAVGRLPGLKAMAYISKGIHEAKVRMKERK